MTFIENPTSITTLNYLEENIFNKLFKNIDCGLIGFPGCGKSAEIKYLIRNILLLKNYSPNHVFVYLDMEVLADNEEKGFREALSFVSNFFGIGNELKVLLNDFITTKNLTTQSFSSFLHRAITETNLKITLVVDNFQKCYNNSRNSNLCFDTISILKRVNPMNISLLFITSHEFGDNISVQLDKLYEPFIQNLIWCGEIACDLESAKCLFANQEHRQKVIFKEKFKLLASELSFGDPTILKILATRATSESTFQDEFISAFSDLNALYSLIGEDVLNARYRRILYALSNDSIKCLMSGFDLPTKYLLKTGLIGVDKVPINGLFEKFLEKSSDDLHEFIINENLQTRSFKSNLSGQELLIFNLLEANANTLIPRDKIALSMWGDKWEVLYSDWAIDRALSNIRVKMKEFGLDRNLKSVKGKGVIFGTQ